MTTNRCRDGRSNHSGAVAASTWTRAIGRVAKVARNIQSSWLSAALSALPFAAAAGAQSSEAGPLTLVAAASDANAAVFADGAALRKVAVGERLPGLPWTLAAVRDARAVLGAERRLDGRRLVLEVAVGERVDAAALAALEAAHAPRPTPDVTIKAVPRSGARRPAKGTP